NISKEDAKKLFVSTVMKRARISEIKDKWVASLFFDWMMQRPGTCMQYIMTKMCKYSTADYQAAKSGYYKSQITDTLLSILNADDAKNTHDCIKSWRLDHLENTSVYESFREGVRDRINSYIYGQ
ncbi:MAG: hypothetical protein RLZZ628_2033, partial [Bacteroidota bacterium]